VTTVGKVCEKCILDSDMVGVTVDAEGLCNRCTNPAEDELALDPALVAEKADEMERIITDMQDHHGAHPFDCVIGFSGGKDSTYLLWKLVHEYGLRPLAVSVNSGFVSKVALQNMTDTLAKLDVAHVVIKPPKVVFARFYKWHVLHHDAPDTPILKRVCGHCSDLIESLVVAEAARRGIPYVLVGLSPDEHLRFFFEIGRDLMHESWAPDYLATDFFGAFDRAWWWDPEAHDTVPRVVFPLHVWPYDEAEVVALCEREGLVKQGNASPLKTNCALIWALGFYDLNRYGYHAYQIPFANLVRNGMADREYWLQTFQVLGPQVKAGKFNQAAVDDFLEAIGMTRAGILQVIAEKREGA